MPGSGPGGLGSGLRIFLFLKIDFRCQSATTDTKKKTIFRIGEMVSVGSTDTYNFLPTDTKDYFCSSVIMVPIDKWDVTRVLVNNGSQVEILFMSAYWDKRSRAVYPKHEGN
jgi:hypothetical protein